MKYRVRGLNADLVTWTSFSDIPEGEGFTPEFDELVHPMHKPMYLKTAAGCRDLADGEDIDAATMHKWWGWVAGFTRIEE